MHRRLALSKSCDDGPCNIIAICEDGVNKIQVVVGHAKVSIVTKEFSHVGLIESVVVNKSMRRKGYGRVVMNRCEQYLTSHGIHDVYLSTPDQQKFYASLGYLECDTPLLGSFVADLDVSGLAALFQKKAEICGADNNTVTWMHKKLAISDRVHG